MVLRWGLTDFARGSQYQLSFCHDSKPCYPSLFEGYCWIVLHWGAKNLINFPEVEYCVHCEHGGETGNRHPQYTASRKTQRSLADRSANLALQTILSDPRPSARVRQAERSKLNLAGIMMSVDFLEVLSHRLRANQKVRQSYSLEGL